MLGRDLVKDFITEEYQVKFEAEEGRGLTAARAARLAVQVVAIGVFVSRLGYSTGCYDSLVSFEEGTVELAAGGRTRISTSTSTSKGKSTVGSVSQWCCIEYGK